MNITKNTIIGDLVAEDYRTATVFKQNGIDFCCNGNRKIADACQALQINSDVLIQQLKDAISQGDTSSTDYNAWPLDLLADYVEKKHHRYVEAKIPEISPFLKKIVSVHGGQHPELREVEHLFSESTSELSMHMKKEELMLFPYIRKMAQAKLFGSTIQPPFGTVQNPIQMMMHEHDTEGGRFRKIASLTNNYTPPANACNTYKVTLAMLKEFEEDLHLHIHLENNILFPKAVKLEKELST